MFSPFGHHPQLQGQLDRKSRHKTDAQNHHQKSKARRPFTSACCSPFLLGLGAGLGHVPDDDAVGHVRPLALLESVGHGDGQLVALLVEGDRADRGLALPDLAQPLLGLVVPHQGGAIAAARGKRAEGRVERDGVDGEDPVLAGHGRVWLALQRKKARGNRKARKRREGRDFDKIAMSHDSDESGRLHSSSDYSRGI